MGWPMRDASPSPLARRQRSPDNDEQQQYERDQRIEQKKHQRTQQKKDQRTAALGRVFAVFDQDGRGVVDSSELLQLKTRGSAELDDAVIARLLVKMDLSGDGMVSAEQFARHFEQALPQDAEQFDSVIQRFLDVASRMPRRKQRNANQENTTPPNTLREREWAAQPGVEPHPGRHRAAHNTSPSLGRSVTPTARRKQPVRQRSVSPSRGSQTRRSVSPARGKRGSNSPMRDKERSRSPARRNRMELERQVLTDMFLPELLKGARVRAEFDEQQQSSTGKVRQSRAVFRDMDLNGDGVVDADEFEAAVAGGLVALHGDEGELPAPPTYAASQHCASTYASTYASTARVLGGEGAARGEDDGKRIVTTEVASEKAKRAAAAAAALKREEKTKKAATEAALQQEARHRALQQREDKVKRAAAEAELQHRQEKAKRAAAAEAALQQREEKVKRAAAAEAAALKREEMEKKTAIEAALQQREDKMKKAATEAAAVQQREEKAREGKIRKAAAAADAALQQREENMRKLTSHPADKAERVAKAMKAATAEQMMRAKVAYQNRDEVIDMAILSPPPTSDNHMTKERVAVGMTLQQRKALERKALADMQTRYQAPSLTHKP